MATNTFKVTGLTCGHCVSAVKEEVGELAGVHNVDVELVKGGESVVTVTADADVSREAFVDALKEAGDNYELAPSHVIG